MPMRRCAWPNCPQLVPVGQRYCQPHATIHDRQRGTAKQRGYGKAHQALRQQWANAIARGLTPTCNRCGQPITRGQAWDLDHAADRQHYRGPAHAHCNRSAGQANSTRMREHWTK